MAEPSTKIRSRMWNIIALAVLAMPVVASAQVTETPTAFDSAGRIRALTPALVLRLGLSAPAWPVQGDYREARVYKAADMHVLAVERLTGAVDRYSLTPDAMRALRYAVDAAVARTGALVTEEHADQLSEPVRGAFVRNQMILSALLYSPALGAQTNNSESGAAIYLLSVGDTYFVVSALSRTAPITRAQNDLATDGAVRGALFAGGLFAAFGPDNPNGKAAALVTLAGSLGGSMIGYYRAQGLTDAEAKAAKSASSYASLTMLGLMGATGVFDSTEARAASLLTVAAGMGGYALGPRYPRRHSYTVTAGDINTLWIGSTLGVATALIPIVGNDSVSDKTAAAAFTLGLLGGGLAAERFWARRYDHTQGEVAQVWLGTLAGGLMGGAVDVLAKPSSPRAAYTIVVAGSVLGALGAHAIVAPRPAWHTADASRGAERNRGVSVEFSPASLAMAAIGARGRYSVLTARF